ncbi:MAG TPA: glycosyltransferase family 39 protein, partial [Chroococcales cyanobacterium]
MSIAPAVRAANNQVAVARFSLERVVRVLCIIAILVGCSLRFINADRKIIVCGETSTQMEVAGLVAESDIYDRYISASDLQNIPLKAGSTICDTLNSCRLNTVFNPPLYFLFGRLWAEHFGTTAVASLRYLSVWLSLLQIPCFYFLGMELFASSTCASVITALAAISPYHLQSAQFFRPYSLWTSLTLLSCATLLWAARKKTLRSWTVYSAVSAFALYTHISALRCLLSQIVYSVLEARGNKDFKPRAPLLATLAAVLLFLPWLHQFHKHLNPSFRGLKWFSGHSHVPDLASSWASQIITAFLDIGNISYPAEKMLSWIAWIAIVGGITIFTRAANPSSRRFVWTLLVTSFLTLSVLDLILGGNSSTHTRYMMPVMVALQTMIGFTVATLSTSQH